MALTVAAPALYDWTRRKLVDPLPVAAVQS
jgi:hypothetical protein